MGHFCAPGSNAMFHKFISPSTGAASWRGGGGAGEHNTAVRGGRRAHVLTQHPRIIQRTLLSLRQGGALLLKQVGAQCFLSLLSAYVPLHQNEKPDPARLNITWSSCLHTDINRHQYMLNSRSIFLSVSLALKSLPMVLPNLFSLVFFMVFLVFVLLCLHTPYFTFSP